MLYQYQGHNAGGAFSGTVDLPQPGIADTAAYAARMAGFGNYIDSFQPIAPAAPVPAPAATTPATLPAPAAGTTTAPAVIQLTTAPAVPPVPPDTVIPPPQSVTVVIGGKLRTVSTQADLQAVLDAGGTVRRDDGSGATIQNIKAPGWTQNAWLVDGNPLNVVLGQGWLPGQRELVAELVGAGQVPAPTLSNQPDVVSPSLFASPWAWAAGLGLLWFLKRR